MGGGGPLGTSALVPSRPRGFLPNGSARGTVLPEEAAALSPKPGVVPPGHLPRHTHT